MDLWIWILLAIAIVILLVVVIATLRVIRPKAPEPLSMAAPLPSSTAVTGTTFGVRPTAPTARAQTTSRPTGPAMPPALAPSVVAQIDTLVVTKKKIEAIRALRAATGSSLQDAKTQIDSWVPSRNGAAASFLREPDAVAQLDPQVRAEIAGFVASGQKISAIKLLRGATGLGLKDAKDAVDSWR